jgi:TRAP transporter TAXI family solute receptor
MRPLLWRVAVLVSAAIVCATVGCARNPEAASPATVVVSIPFSGAWESIGRTLTAEYNHRLPAVRAEAVMAESLESQADAMQQGRADLALEDAETAYLAYSRGTAKDSTPHARLRAISVMFSIAVQVAVRADSGITRIEQLRGRKVDIGPPGGSVNRASRIILESYGIHETDVQRSFGAPNPVEQLVSGAVDARVFYSAFKHPSIDAISRQTDVRVLPIDRDRLGAIQEQHHFLKLTTIPAGTYPKQDRDVQTVGMDVLLLCRQDLPEALVYDLTRTLFDAVPALERAHEAASAIDPERGPTASIPLHPGAARFYREREILK